MNLKLRVKQLAIEQGLTKMALSRRANLNIATINKVWQDANVDVGNMETETLEKLATALGVTRRDLEAPNDK